MTEARVWQLAPVCWLSLKWKEGALPLASYFNPSGGDFQGINKTTGLSLCSTMPIRLNFRIARHPTRIGPYVGGAAPSHNGTSGPRSGIPIYRLVMGYSFCAKPISQDLEAQMV